MIRLYDFRPAPEDEQAVLAALRAGQWADGPSVRAFESTFAALTGVPYAVAAANGTAALQAVCAACLSPGDEVVTTPFTFIATANALRSCGAIPRFADVDEATGNLTAVTVQEALARYPGARGLLAVHLFGRPCEMRGLLTLAQERGLTLLEDCAQAAGATYGDQPVGSFGLAGTFSFYATKNLAAGEGGMVTTADGEIAAAVRRFINHGRGDAPYHHVTLGYNFRMHGLAAALAASRLERLRAENESRRKNALTLREGLGDLPWLVLPPDDPGHVYHQFVVRTPDRAALRLHLATLGIESGVYYPDVIYHQPAYAGLEAAPCPTAEQLAREVLALPVRPSLTRAELEAVIAAVRKFRPPRRRPTTRRGR